MLPLNDLARRGRIICKNDERLIKNDGPTRCIRYSPLTWYSFIFEHIAFYVMLAIGPSSQPAGAVLWGQRLSVRSTATLLKSECGVFADRTALVPLAVHAYQGGSRE